ncbi:hypothetical protein F1188_02515 [Roseospira marina]|uniref:Uncharacterized protein n=1 Tax=Roseospira marina TaxID=140057 RepID=A0A5M6IIF8_9PROT|nr:hypothetical protein [Roseospira marina]KAA5607649.1 hypothetical protein F1188_02515 [Roseospira marina]MBB4312150.1 hypothetical protein [Roseospira marina]MBB5085834.1 hypothetical protein [Roseospira marina]
MGVALAGFVFVLGLAPPLVASGRDAAAQAPEPWPEEPPPVVAVDAATCRQLVRHVPDPDVTYQPGVDVRGRTVAPADLQDYSGFDAMIPDTVTFHIVLDPFERTGVVPPQGIESPGTVLGTVGYDLNRGTFTVNGRPLTTGEQDTLARACVTRLSGVAPGGGPERPPE